jgi:L-cysteine/cystine lyase
VGGLYVRPEARDSLKPTFIGWRGIITDGEGKPISWQPDGRRYEVATSALSQYAGLRAAISTHQEWGTATERYQQICSLSQYLWQRLTQLPEAACGLTHQNRVLSLSSWFVTKRSFLLIGS